jgi:hypothetical protein
MHDWRMQLMQRKTGKKAAMMEDIPAIDKMRYVEKLSLIAVAHLSLTLTSPYEHWKPGSLAASSLVPQRMQKIRLITMPIVAMINIRHLCSFACEVTLMITSNNFSKTKLNEQRSALSPAECQDEAGQQSANCRGGKAASSL